MIDQLKIALVTGGLPFGGSTIFLLQLAGALRTLGIPSEIYSFRDENPLAADFAAAGVPVHTTNEVSLIFEDRLTILYRKMAQFGPNIVIASLGTEAFEMLRYAPAGVMRIGIVHDIGTRNGIAFHEDNLDAIALVNPRWAKEGVGGTRNLPCEFIAHGIPIPEKDVARNANAHEPLRLTFFGALAEQKGTRVFPQIVNQLRSRSIPFRWSMYGDGPDEPYLRRQLSSEIQAGEVTISPKFSRGELFQTVRKHDIFIMASEAEGGPFTLLEAMSVGLVPICNDIPCLAQEVLNSENGFIIPRDPAKYAEIISILHNDRPRLERMSAAARQTITEQYSTKAMAERYLKFITKIYPNPDSIPWPARVSPKPLSTSGAFARLSQNNPVARQLRRMVKRARR